MSDLLRTLNPEGKSVFEQYLQSLREGTNALPPFHILDDPQYSDEIETDVALQKATFADSYEFGCYLKGALQSLDRRRIAYDHGLWSWLALYFFDQICPVDNGQRSVLETAVYILAGTYNHQRYYRHLVRTPWVAVFDHGEKSKVLLQTRAGGKRSDLFEQLAAQQTIFGNTTVIAAVYDLYYDSVAQSPKKGSGGKGAGSPRRLTAFIRQIDLTYDLWDCSPQQFIGMLPREFDKFSKPKAVLVGK